LRARVADFLWEHDDDRTHTDGLTAIDSYLEMADALRRDRATGAEAVDALQRALELSMRLNDQTRAFRCRDALMEAVAGFVDRGFLAHARDVVDVLCLLSGRWQRTLLPAAVLVDLAAQLAEQARRSAEKGHFDFERQLRARLCRIHRLRRDDCAVRTVEMETARSFRREAEARAAEQQHAVAAHFFDQAARAYEQLGARQDAAAMKLASRDQTQAAAKQMSCYETTMTIPRDLAEQYISTFTDAPDMASAIERFAQDDSWLCDPQRSRQQAESLCAGSPLPAMIAKSVVKGDRVAVEATEEAAQQRYFDNQAYAVWLNAFLVMRHHAFLTLRDARGLAVGDVVAHLRSWPLLPPQKLPLLQHGIERLFAADWISAIHVLVPHIEDVLRRVLRSAGIASTVLRPDGSQGEQTLGGLLQQPEVERAIGAPLHRTATYLLVDEQGLSLRTDVAHGLIPAERCDVAHAEVALWLLLTLTALRPLRDTAGTPEEVARLAHARWEARGGGHGRHVEDWLASERVLSATHSSRVGKDVDRGGV
jgi:hypothetical protein